MKLGMNQPYFFPYLGFYQLVSVVDTFILYDNLNYFRYGWINRNRLLVVNGAPAYFNAVTENSSSYKKIRDIKLSKHPSWRRKVLNSLFLNYKKSEFFSETYELIEGVLLSETDSLSALNTKSIVDVCRYLNIESGIIENPDYESLEMELERDDLPAVFPSINLQNPAKKVIRIIKICESMKATTFINLIGGQSLYDKAAFKSNGIDLFFLRSLDCPYKQMTTEYHPRLSIVDVLMNCGREGTIELLKNYELV